MSGPTGGTCGALELRQVLGNGEPQAGALGGAGFLAPDEALHQLGGGNVELLAGDIFDGEDDVSLPVHNVFCPLPRQNLRTKCKTLALGA